MEEWWLIKTYKKFRAKKVGGRPIKQNSHMSFFSEIGPNGLQKACFVIKRQLPQLPQKLTCIFSEEHIIENG